jgi:hypothetical protein
MDGLQSVAGRRRQDIGWWRGFGVFGEVRLWEGKVEKGSGTPL